MLQFSQVKSWLQSLVRDPSVTRSPCITDVLQIRCGQKHITLMSLLFHEHVTRLQVL